MFCSGLVKKVRRQSSANHKTRAEHPSEKPSVTDGLNHSVTDGSIHSLNDGLNHFLHHLLNPLIINNGT